MLIRFIVRNIFSFNEETEFNVFPNKTQRLPHHKIRRNDVDILRLSAIYGANGAGKSNLIKAISSLNSMILEGTIKKNLDEIKFQLNKENEQQPISLGIEFFNKSKIYYYTLTFDEDVILNESLFESNTNEDKLIFERNFENSKQTINFYDGYIKDEKNKLFTEVLQEKLVQKNELLISFLNSKYPTEFVDVSNAFEWFYKVLFIIKPDDRVGPMAYILDKNKKLKSFVNEFIETLSTGVSKISVLNEKLPAFVEEYNKDSLDKIIDKIKDNPKQIPVLRHPDTGEEVSLSYENNEVVVKRLVTSHLNNKGEIVDFSIGMESDGTKRLIEYIPAFAGIINSEKVFLIDEIERSIHPIMIKEIVSKISSDVSAKGQLIFTTHESCLLDQDILRPDEIWFVQKDIDGASKLYSLSDYNIHHTANIENGYLNGRFGGIPFLSNLKDLNWHKHEVSEQE